MLWEVIGNHMQGVMKTGLIYPCHPLPLVKLGTLKLLMYCHSLHFGLRAFKCIGRK